LNRIEEPDTKIEKNWRKSKSTFWTFLGSAVLAGAVALFFIKKNTATGFFFLHLLKRKIRDFFYDLAKSTFLACENSKSYGNFEF
jgi:hypothetical protein